MQRLELTFRVPPTRRNPVKLINLPRIHIPRIKPAMVVVSHLGNAMPGKQCGALGFFIGELYREMGTMNER